MKIAIAIIFVLATASTVWSATATPTLTAVYDFPADQEYRISGYTLYMNGVEVCSTDDPTVREFACEVMVEDSEQSFTLVARHVSDPTKNSEHSEPYLFTPPIEWFGEVPTPTNLNVTGVVVQVNVTINN